MVHRGNPSGAARILSQEPHPDSFNIMNLRLSALLPSTLLTACLLTGCGDKPAPEPIATSEVPKTLDSAFNSASAETKAAAAGVDLETHYATLGKTVPLGRVGRAEEAASVITFLVSDMASFVTGSSINIDGGASAVF